MGKQKPEETPESRPPSLYATLPDDELSLYGTDDSILAAYDRLDGALA